MIEEIKINETNINEVLEEKIKEIAMDEGYDIEEDTTSQGRLILNIEVKTDERGRPVLHLYATANDLLDQDIFCEDTDCIDSSTIVTIYSIREVKLKDNKYEYDNDIWYEPVNYFQKTFDNIFELLEELPLILRKIRENRVLVSENLKNIKINTGTIFVSI